MLNGEEIEHNEPFLPMYGLLLKTLFAVSKGARIYLLNLLAKFGMNSVAVI